MITRDSTLQIPSVKSRAVQFHAPTELVTQLALRADHDSSSALNGVARELTLRALGFLQRAAFELQDVFTLAEMQLLCDASNGTIYDENTLYLFAAGIEDHIHLNRAAARWGAVEDALLLKLRRLSDGARWALVDALERFWAHPELYSADEAGFAALGIKVSDTQAN